MAEETDNDDQWLYGDYPDFHGTEENEKQEVESEAAPKEEQPKEENQENISLPEAPEANEEQSEELDEKPECKSDEPAPPGAADEAEEEKQNGDNFDKEDSDEDESDDDDVNVVIGDIKTSPAYTPLNIKRSGLISSAATDKNKINQQQSGKFSVDEFDQMGMINGVPSGDFNMDSMDDKPWRKPGADITDYFNYGFNEDTWKAYCERQKRIRVNDSGVGLVPLNSIGMPRGPVPIMNDNSKYSGSFTGIRKAGPPPGRRMTGAIDVIGSTSQAPPGKMDAPKENIIQVMTADRREYSRKPPGFPDMSMPPPQSFEEFQPEFGFNPEPEPFYGGYEPTQDVQWGHPGMAVGPPVPAGGLPPAGGPPSGPIPPPIVPPVLAPRGHTLTPQRESPPARSRDSVSKESEHEGRRHEKSRDRERSHRRERSRSRSRRHKSRSRSPSHRHRKKKSRRHDDSD